MWIVFVALLAAELALPYAVSPRPDPWHPAQTAVAGFVLALFSLALAEGTFALREALVVRDAPPASVGRRSLAPAAHVAIARLATLWALCLLIGFFGDLLAYGSGAPTAATPYVIAGAALLVLHAPGRRLVAGLGARSSG